MEVTRSRQNTSKSACFRPITHNASYKSFISDSLSIFGSAYLSTVKHNCQNRKHFVSASRTRSVSA